MVVEESHAVSWEKKHNMLFFLPGFHKERESMKERERKTPKEEAPRVDSLEEISMKLFVLKTAKNFAQELIN